MRLQTLREARWIFFVLIVVTLLLALFSKWLALLGVALIFYTFYFFRDPDRVSPDDARAVVAAADGLVVEIIEMVEPEVLKMPMQRIAIFLSVFDVHTNRAPVDSTVTYSKRYVGKFLDARHPDATRLNEYHTWAFKNERATLVVRQITGAIARRIVGWSQIGDMLKKGERFGMIRFGSRTEIYVPIGSEILVKVNDRVKGGETVVAKLP